MELLEREQPLSRLVAAMAAVARDESGSCALIAGEAGVGKTSLVRAFLAGLHPGTPVLQTGCEDLYTPRPLGPLIDLADRLPPSIGHALEQGRVSSALFPIVLRHLRALARPGVLVVEDLHWADIGTLDMLRYLGRRLQDVPLLLVFTHRADGLAPDHPLRAVLGDLPAGSTLRLALEPLSRTAVETLAHVHRRDADGLFEATGGNPFYLSELLAAPAGVLPLPVRDAVGAALARLPAEARDLAAWVSMIPGRIERALLERVASPELDGLEPCLRSGLLQIDPQGIAFRHEIARRAVHDSLTELQRLGAHRAIFDALSSPGGTVVPARLVHHAEAAGLHEQLAALAPVAARQASASGAHREAARLFGLTLEYHPDDASTDRADLLEAQAHEWMLTNRHDDAIACRERARAIRAAHGDRLREAVNLRWLARLHWFARGSSPQAYRLAREAINMLEALPLHRELALACTSLSHLCLGGDDLEGAQRWGLRAIELAEELDDAEALCHALTNVASARLRLHDDAMAWERLHRSLSIALSSGFEPDAARAYVNLFIHCVVHRDFKLALRYAQDGIAFSETKGLDVYTVRLLVRRAFAFLVMGRWDLVDADLHLLATRHTLSAMEGATRDFMAAILALRRGGPDARARLDASIDAMANHHASLWFTSSAAVLAEAAWLAGDDAAIDEIVGPSLAHARSIGDRWGIGELAAWRRRAGVRTVETIPGLPEPYALELRGCCVDAAQAWQQLGCPYDRALALASGDEAAQRQAVVIFDELGAVPAAQRVRRNLHAVGARGVARGPQPRTRGDALGLTAREREVFELARRGVPTGTIASRLHRSGRTVEHHLASVYRKLGVGQRAELMARYPAPAMNPSTT